MKKPTIVITPGEPAGIGPDITLHILQQPWPANLMVVCDPDLLIARAKLLGISLDDKKFQIIPISLSEPCHPGQLNPANANYVLRCLETATDLCLTKKADALVTGPIHKGIMNSAGIPFTGHTEFLANYCHAKQSLMLFVTEKLKVALMTTHLRLADVPKAITREKLRNTLLLLNEELKTRFQIQQPHLLVCGLNPHAGEQGYLGSEEIDIMEPVIAELCKMGLTITGPLPADTVFTPHYLQFADAILAMYHDQALPVVKYLGFGHAVNVTLGLPIIRTSVDHGTALDIVGTSSVDAGSMMAAVALAVKLIN